MATLPPPPTTRCILRALHLHDLQKLESPDPLVRVHTELFSLLMREIAKTSLEERGAQQQQLLQQQLQQQLLLQQGAARAAAQAAAAAGAAGGTRTAWSS
ncbi:hypothetical protein ETH_00038030, partial [Eimeria tenella]